MKLLPVFIQVAGELGVGTAFFLCLQKTGEIRQSFFNFMAWIMAVSFFLMALALQGSRFYANVYFPPAIFAAAAAMQFSRNRLKSGKSISLFSALFALFFLIKGTWETSSKTGCKELALLNLSAGIFLFGWSNGAMILGHWYLIMRGLSFSYFRQATFQLLVALGVRTIGFGVASYYVFHQSAMVAGAPVDMLFFSMRILWGIVVPSVFAFMAWRCALIGSNQAGTGLLYIAEVAVLIGEILAGFLGM
jgi:hypothetical protein